MGITDGWDRRTNSSYLKVLIKPELLLGSNLAPNFKSPDPSRYDYDAYRKYIDEKLPQESPILFYLHSNAEISYLTAQGEFMFDAIFNVQGGSASSGGDNKKDSLGDDIKRYTEKLLACIPFKLAEIKGKVPVLGPYDVVAVQECERINNINANLLRTLEELVKGINGELNITDAMEDLQYAIRYNKLPDAWQTFAGYPSKKSLNFWFEDLMKRYEQLSEWSKELILPKAVNITLLCAPMSFVTAVKQVTARAENYSLDDLEIMTEVTNVTEDEGLKEPPTTGVLVFGMFIQGARWEDPGSDVPGFLAEMTPKELDPKIPYMNVFAVKIKDRITIGYYECPVYYTTARGATYIFTAFMKMESEESDPNKWVLAGVALV